MSFESREALRAFAARSRRDLDIKEFQHDLEWLDAGIDRASQELRIVADCTADRLSGLLPARVADGVLEYTVRGRTLVRLKIRQYTVHQGPVLARDADLEAPAQAVAALGDEMPANGALYLSAVPTDSLLHASLSAAKGILRSKFHVLPWGNENDHYKISWSGGVKSYLASLSTKRRANAKRASANFKSPHQLNRFQRPEDVDAFLREAKAISQKSNQSPDVGYGALESEGRNSLIRFAAAQGAFLGFTLCVNEAPIAYRYGFVYGQTLFAISTAYDAGWSEHKPGAIIFLEVLAALEKNKVPITMIDLLPHENSFKRDRANLVVPTRNYYLFKRSARNAARLLPIFLVEQAKRASGRFRQQEAAAKP
jgi:hypothetical protein